MTKGNHDEMRKKNQEGKKTEGREGRRKKKERIMRSHERSKKKEGTEERRKTEETRKKKEARRMNNEGGLDFGLQTKTYYYVNSKYSEVVVPRSFCPDTECWWTKVD